MSTQYLRCNDCGASIHVPGEARHVTCAGCGAELSVRGEGEGRFAEVVRGGPPLVHVEPVGPDERDLVQRVDERAIEDELWRLERDWREERQLYTVYTTRGRIIPPRAAVLVGLFFTATAVGSALIGAIVLVVVNGVEALPIVACFGVPALPFLVLIVVMNTLWYRKAKGYEVAHARFQREHARLVRELEGPRWRGS